MAIRAATKKVLSPISETMIMVKEKTSECKGSAAGCSSNSSLLVEDVPFVPIYISFDEVADFGVATS